MAPSAESTHKASIAGNGANEEYADVKWDSLGFGLTPTDFMYVMKCSIGEGFSEGKLIPYGNIELSPAAGILNYGQGLFEGLKAYRTEDGRIVLFRPEENALRMQMGAERLRITCPSTEQFISAVKKTVVANKRWVPPPGRGSLYLRPLLIGSGAALGVGPSNEYTFLIYASPVGNYHKGKLNLYVEDKVFRACPGGTGGIKSVTNYAPVYDVTTEAKAKGFSDVLFLDAATKKNIEEVASCNIFVVKGNAISTPATHGTILPGITRKSIIELALEVGYQVEERDISLEEVLNAEEAFCTGTAVVVNPVASITYQDKRTEYKMGDETVAQKLHAILTAIQRGVVKDTKGWIVEVF